MAARPSAAAGRSAAPRTATSTLAADDAVSRQHAEIAVRAGICLVRDLGSANGTLLNGRFVTRARLRRGDVLELGETELQRSLVEDLEPDHARGERARVHLVAAAAGVDRERVGGFGVADVDRGLEAGQRRRGALAGERQSVAPGRSVDRDPVGGAVALGRDREAGEADVDELEAGTVGDRDRVGAAAGDEVDLLEVVEGEDVRVVDEPAALDANDSAAFAPSRKSESREAPPSIVSLPSPRASWAVEVAAERDRSRPAPPTASSKPGPPTSVSSPGPPSRTLSPAPPTSVSAIEATDALRMSSPPRPSIVSRSIGSGSRTARRSARARRTGRTRSGRRPRSRRRSRGRRRRRGRR